MIKWTISEVRACPRLYVVGLSIAVTPVLILLSLVMVLSHLSVRTWLERAASHAWYTSLLKPENFGYMIYSSSTFVLVWIFVVTFITCRRLRRHFVDNKALPCSRCLYDLSALKSPGRCPECGHAFDHSQVIEYWRVFARRNPMVGFDVIPRTFAAEDLSRRQEARKC